MPSPHRLLIHFAVLLGTGIVAFACAETSVPSLVDAQDDGSGGSGGGMGGMGGENAASSSSSSGMTGPCTTAEDCADVSDACNLGTCINGVCQKSPANESAPCDDGKQCTTSDHCEAGLCTGPLKVCSATSACHVGSCDIESDTCVEVPGNDGAGCVDDDACSLTSVCQSGTCVGAQQVDCSFLDSLCGQGVCDPATGCVAQPKNDGTACNDGLFCTDNDVCSGGACSGAPKVCVPPSDPCNTGVCNEAQQKCLIVPGNDGAACDDASTCTMGETCLGGACGDGQPSNVGGACSDADACSTVDTCDAAGNCVGGGLITSCIGSDGCCPAACDISTDADCVPACCGDDMNPNPPDNNCSQGAAWIAWEYVPSCGFNVTRLELHTDGGSVALLADAGNFPGPLLFQGVLGAPDASGFLGADVNPPIALVGGQKYWLAEAVGICSIAANGSAPTYYGSFGDLSGPWSGPFNGHAWTAHVVGECGP
jgi:hypothetical protein